MNPPQKAHISQLGAAVWCHHRPRGCLELGERDCGGGHEDGTVVAEHRVHLCRGQFVHPEQRIHSGACRSQRACREPRRRSTRWWRRLAHPVGPARWAAAPPARQRSPGVSSLTEAAPRTPWSSRRLCEARHAWSLRRCPRAAQSQWVRRRREWRQLTPSRIAAGERRSAAPPRASASGREG
eukprot:scaffold5612_cov108-Isochrysis_galbana.AAC.3